MEIDADQWISNGVAGTIQGGVQSLLAEIAAQHAVKPRELAVVDLDIRFLNRVRSGPVTASADVASAEAPTQAIDDTFVRVAITDAGDDGRLVAVNLICRP